MARIASPVEYPGATAPFRAIDVNRLKRVMFSGPYTRFKFTKLETGAISPELVFTNTLLRPSVLLRYAKSLCTITRYSLPNWLMFEV